MKYIIDGLAVIIDDEDYTKISRYRWHLMKIAEQENGLFYFKTSMKINEDIGYKDILLHRFIIGCVYKDGLIVDHINHNTLDCRRSNLRVCTHKQNSHNARIYRNKSNPYKGVRLERRTGRWQARITDSNGIRVALGTYSTPEDAAKAFDKAAILYQGEFAVTNFPKEYCLNLP